MAIKKRTRIRFSLKSLLVFVTLSAVVFGTWIAYSNFKIRKLVELRQQGVIVILRDGTPHWLKSIGIKRLSPFSRVPTVELYVTPMGSDAIVGNSENLTSNVIAQELIMEQVSTARAHGAEDIQLILVGSFSPEWMAFANDNSLSSIGDSKQRYAARLKANQKTGANINP